MTPRTTAAGLGPRPDEPALDTFEAAVQHLAEVADLYRSNALSAISSHVGAAAEVIRARTDERGDTSTERDAGVAGMIEALRTDLNAHLDRLAAKRPGS